MKKKIKEEEIKIEDVESTDLVPLSKKEEIKKKKREMHNENISISVRNVCKKKKLMQSLKNNLGNITAACLECGMNRKTFYKYYENDPKFKAEYDTIDEVIFDMVEEAWFKNIKEQDQQAIALYLKYKGKKRGYDDIPVQFVFSPKLKDDI